MQKHYIYIYIYIYIFFGDIKALIISKLIFYCLVDFHTLTGKAGEQDYKMMFCTIQFWNKIVNDVLYDSVLEQNCNMTFCMIQLCNKIVI